MPISTEQAWNRFHIPIQHFILHYTHDEVLTEDILQDVFLKMHIHIQTLNDEKKLQSWLYDVVISNCVINLSADKSQVLREAYRVLNPNGRFAVSDIVIQGSLPIAIQQDMEAWAGCIAGALEEETYRNLLAEAGFTDIEIEVTRRYSLQEVAESGASTAIAVLSQSERDELDGKFVSAFIHAKRPA